MAVFKDISGQKFGRWTVICIENRHASVKRWKCRCECGQERVVSGVTLKNGTSQSCGCVAKDWCRSHGMEGTRTYNCWAAMKQRCQNPKSKSYAGYGGRGITVCEKWQTFEGFFEDMGEQPEGLSLERKENDLGYTLENCKWATAKEQMRNRRVTVMHEGRPIAEIAEENGLSPKLLRERLKAGYTGADLIAKGRHSRWHKAVA